MNNIKKVNDNYFIRKMENGSVLGMLEANASIGLIQKSLNWHQFKNNTLPEWQSEKKKKEWFCVRLLLSEIFKGQSIHLCHDDHGKPFLSDSFYRISISHSGAYICVLVNQHLKVGVDVQVYKPNIEKGVNLFMSDQELEDLSGKWNPNILHVYWGAKEAIYKLIGSKGTNIKTDIYISSFEFGKSGSLEGQVFLQKKVNLNYEITDQYVLVYTI